MYWFKKYVVGWIPVKNRVKSSYGIQEITITQYSVESQKIRYVRQ